MTRECRRKMMSQWKLSGMNLINSLSRRQRMEGAMISSWKLEKVLRCLFSSCADRDRWWNISRQIFQTVLQQLWKHNFRKELLVNPRFLHIRDWLPKTYEELWTHQIPQKAFRTWFSLHGNSVTSVKTPSGVTESREAGEICAQGSSGAALASQADIVSGIKCYFENSTDEAKYGSVRVQLQSYPRWCLKSSPFSFQCEGRKR